MRSNPAGLAFRVFSYQHTTLFLETTLHHACEIVFLCCCRVTGANLAQPISIYVLPASTPYVFVTWTRIEDPVPPRFPSSFRIEDRHVQHKHRIVITTAKPKEGRLPTASADLDLFGTFGIHFASPFNGSNIPRQPGKVFWLGSRALHAVSFGLLKRARGPICHRTVACCGSHMRESFESTPQARPHRKAS